MLRRTRPGFAISPHYCGSTSEWVPRKKRSFSRRGLRPITGIHLADIHAALAKTETNYVESSGTLRQGRCAADLSTKDATDKGQCPNFRLEAGVAPGSRSVSNEFVANSRWVGGQRPPLNGEEPEFSAASKRGIDFKLGLNGMQGRH